MYASLSGAEDGLVGYWPLDEGTGGQARDHSKYHNDGAMLGSPVWIEIAAPKPNWLLSADSGTLAPGANTQTSIFFFPRDGRYGIHTSGKFSERRLFRFHQGRRF
jgi:hypothetical protein